jgi:hypothetical protein
MKGITALLGAIAVSLWLASPASAHFGGEAFILVPVDHVNPGEPFEIIVADLTPGASTVIEARRDGQSVEAGRTVSDTEGHFSTTGSLPTDYPHGYTELVATAEDGTTVSTWILVGPRSATTGPPPVSNAARAGIDPSLLVLGILLGGSVGAVGYLLLRRTRPAKAAVPTHRVVARKRARRRSNPS